jgi:hypothetical protein
MSKGKRGPRPPNLPATYDAALEAEILKEMSGWPAEMEAKLKAVGLENFAGGDLLWEAMFERELANPNREPDTLATIIWLAERGILSAQAALRNHTTELLEDGKVDLPSSMRAYLVRLINNLVPPHPGDRSEVIKTMLRDTALVAAIDVAASRWPNRPQLNSSGRAHSIAWLIAQTWGRYGHPLTERQVRRIYQDRKKLTARLLKFLTGDHTI